MIKQIPHLIEHITKEIREFTDIAVIGLSGGADSTLVAILCMLALGKDNVYGVSMPCNNESDCDISDNTLSFANYINIKHFTIPLWNITDNLVDRVKFNLFDKVNLDNLTEGNIRARTRMTTLYAVCEVFGRQLNNRCRVIGTGNLSEDFIGYATKYGDMGVDINPIGDLFKSEVYQLLDFFKEHIHAEINGHQIWGIVEKLGGKEGDGIIKEEHIDRVPSAHLWKGQTDEKEIGMTYDDMEKVIRKMMKPKMDMTEPIPDNAIFEKTMKMHIDNKHKMDIVPVVQLREFCD